ncbi:hypothetical protein [Flavobacterium sp. AJR]|uniref:hypothetical protein n=1 Tax=Flavobacterium sp. AJR TaxID=1979369 RepID=UPI000A3D77BC|nr:hypothetical protein [Flavobacterium sp. AJR]OUL60536.1 hypothetical protein B8T70_19895 [Flavobacterium sp. AJR]
MKTTYKLILYSILILIISTIGITYWYVSDHLLSHMSSMSMRVLIDIAIYIGLAGAFIPTFSFLIIYFLIRKVKNKWLLSLLLIILFAVVLAIVYWFVLCAIFQDHDNPQSFISRFLGL